MAANLKSEAVSKEELTVRVILGRSVRRAGFEREAALFKAVANCVSPMAREGAVKKPKVFQVLNGASSSYCPKVNSDQEVLGIRVSVREKNRTKTHNLDNLIRTFRFYLSFILFANRKQVCYRIVFLEE